SRTERITREAAQERVQRMNEIWNRVGGNMADAQERMRVQANRHRRAIDFNVGDYVYLDLSSYNVDCRTRKLAQQNSGPHEILEKVGNSYRLRLPDSMTIHPVVSPDKLRKADNDPLPGQTADEPEPIEVDGQNEWVVERILASKISRGVLRYK